MGDPTLGYFTTGINPRSSRDVKHVFTSSVSAPQLHVPPALISRLLALPLSPQTTTVSIIMINIVVTTNIPNNVNNEKHKFIKTSHFSKYDIQATPSFMKKRCQPNSEQLTAQCSTKGLYRSLTFSTGNESCWLDSFIGEGGKKMLLPRPFLLGRRDLCHSLTGC